MVDVDGVVDEQAGGVLVQVFPQRAFDGAEIRAGRGSGRYAPKRKLKKASKDRGARKVRVLGDLDVQSVGPLAQTEACKACLVFPLAKKFLLNLYLSAHSKIGQKSPQSNGFRE